MVNSNSLSYPSVAIRMFLVFRRFVVFIGLLTFSVYSVSGQREQRAPVPQSDIPEQEIDSTQTNSKPSSALTIFSGNPGRATLYSLMLPGAGQVYNGRWWKVPLVYALEGGSIYFLRDRIKLYRQWDRCYISLVENSTAEPIADCQNVRSQSDAFRIRNSYRSQREQMWLVVIGVHLFQALEAFIDRHLIDFDTDDNLTFQSDYLQPVSPSLTFFKVSIPLSR